mgnify:CR=1 FL=1
MGERDALDTHFEIQEISFQEIKNFWATHLWPSRQSLIEPVSCINSEGDIDIRLKEFIPLFYGQFFNNNLIGAISSCQTNFDEFRMRGLCVAKDHRGSGFSTRLIKTVFENITESVPKPTIWTLSRDTNFEFYNQFDFYKHKSVLNYEYGPHIILKNDNPKKTILTILT